MSTKCVYDFAKDANNVYRTNRFIVKQQISIVVSANCDSYIISNDTYYLRTLKRDFEYNLLYSKRKNPDGRRMPASTYIRKYVC